MPTYDCEHLLTGREKLTRTNTKKAMAYCVVCIISNKMYIPKQNNKPLHKKDSLL